MRRLIEKIVFWGFVTCCRRAGAPTSRCPSFVNATTEGVVRPPSALGMTDGSPPSRTAMHELVVPRSIPIVFAMSLRVSFQLVLRKSKRLCSRSGRCADERAAGDYEQRAEEEAAPDALVRAEDERRERDAPQRLRRDERRHDGDAPVEVRLEEAEVGGAEQDPGG